MVERQGGGSMEGPLCLTAGTATDLGALAEVQGLGVLP